LKYKTGFLRDLRGFVAWSSSWTPVEQLGMDPKTVRRETWETR
jgi:hypothetical protein